MAVWVLSTVLGRWVLASVRIWGCWAALERQHVFHLPSMDNKRKKDKGHTKTDKPAALYRLRWTMRHFN